MVSFHPQAQTPPISLQQALEGVRNTPYELEQSHYPPGSVYQRLLVHMKPWENGNKYHPQQALYGLKRLAWDRPCTCVLKGEGVRSKACQCCHPTENRRLTIPELKRVSSFPDAFRLPGPTAEQWARLGNCVPPCFMEAIARHVYEMFLRPARKGISQ